MKKLIEKIEEVREEARTWLAGDGGLTMAACDLLDACDRVQKMAEANEALRLWKWAGDPFRCDTGAESDLVCAALEWAHKKIRRQIEDRLRKDEILEKEK